MTRWDQLPNKNNIQSLKNFLTKVCVTPIILCLRMKTHAVTILHNRGEYRGITALLSAKSMADYQTLNAISISIPYSIRFDQAPNSIS